MSIHIIPSLSDNYIYALSYGSHCIIVDPGEAAPVKEFLQKQNLSLEAILLTHYHIDHVGGVEDLNCSNIFGPKDCLSNLEIGPFQFEVLSTPGHTKDHISFFEPKLEILFCGDVLFGAGCGRVFEGTNTQMWESLKKLRALPDETQVYFGHEYTKSNLEFSKKLLPNDLEIALRLNDLEAVSVPSTIDLEKRANLFLRADDAATAKALGMEKASAEEVFSYLRDLKSSS